MKVRPGGPQPGIKTHKVCNCPCGYKFVLPRQMCGTKKCPACGTSLKV